MSKPFNCRKHCTIRLQLWADAGHEFQRQIEDRGKVEVTNILGAGSVFTNMAINKAYEEVLSGDEGLDPADYDYSFMGGMPACGVSPRDQDSCPLPDQASDRYREVAVEIARRTIESMIS
jgi:hypothetical protein